MSGRRTKSGNLRKKKRFRCVNCGFVREGRFKSTSKCPKCGKPHHVNLERKYAGIVKHNKIERKEKGVA